MIAYVFSAANVAQGLAEIEAGMRGLAGAQGYIVDGDGNVVGNSAKTGKPRPEAQRTVSWAVPVELTDGRRAVTSYRDYLSREVEGTPLWQMVDAGITVPFTHEDVTALLPPEPEDEE